VRVEYFQEVAQLWLTRPSKGWKRESLSSQLVHSLCAARVSKKRRTPQTMPIPLPPLLTRRAHQALAIRAIVQTHLDGERRSRFVQHGIILVIPGVNRQIFARVASWEAVRMQRRRGDFVVMDAKFVANAQCLPPRRMSLSCPLPQLFRELIEQPARKFCMVITARFASPVARRSLEITLAMNPITSSRSIVRAAAISRCR
jgi:hypothetical protein